MAAGLVLAGSAGASAQTSLSLSRAGSGARAAGMGDAFVAVSDDGTAASWNPAGLAQLRQPEFSLVYGVSERGLRLSGLRSPDDRFAYAAQPMNTTTSFVDFASAALPFSLFGKPVTVQAGWHRLYQLTGQFGGDVDRYLTSQPGVLAGSVTLDDRLVGSIDVISAAGAVKLASRTAIGVSVDFWRGGWNERVSLVETPGRQGADAFLSTRTVSRMRGRNASVGLLLTYPRWNLGLVYHAPFWASFRSSMEVHSTQGPEQSGSLPGARWRLPRSVAAGVAWRPAARWTAAATLTHDQWTDSVVDHIPGVSGPLNFFDGQAPALSSTRDTVSLNLGAERLFVREGAVLPLRLGLGWEPQGAMDLVTRDPVDYFLVSAGAGYNTNRVKFDASLQYRWGTYRSSAALTVDSSLAGGFVRDAIGNAAGHELRLKVSVIYRIQDTEKLRGILRKVFG